MNTIVEALSSWTNDGKLAILIFIPFAVLLFFVALKLVHYAEVIIIKTRFGGGFVGGALIAAVTSLPELITEVAQSSAGFPGAGTADDLGSNAFSGLLIAISLLIFFKSRFLKKLNRFSQVSIFISGFLAFAFFILMFINKDVDLGIIGIIPLLFFLIYLIMLFIQYKFDDSQESPPSNSKIAKVSVKKAIILFTAFALLLTGLALIVNWSASAMILGFGLPEGGIGGVLLAITTSLPEVVAYFVFLKKKQPIAGMAALIGSHFFNLGISFFGDLAFSSGPTFNEPSVGANWPLALLTAIIMFMIFFQTVASKKIKNKYFHLVMPLVIISVYTIGWVLILALPII